MYRYGNATIIGCLLGLGAALQSVRSQPLSTVDEQLVRRADVVVVGRVAQMRSEWNNDRTRIVTHVTVAVDDFLKGKQNQRSLVISVPGGEVDGVGELYTHTPKFTANEMVVLFVQRDPTGALRVAGGEAGKITITQDQMTGKKVVGENQLLDVFTNRLKSAIHQQQTR